MKKNFFAFVFAAAALFAASCSRENVPQGPDVLNLPDMKLLVLNNGSFNKNNSSVSYYIQENRSLTSIGSLFKKTNGQGLGDTAQDLIQVGKNYWISVNVSKVIHVIAPDFKLVKTIKVVEAGVELSPRYMCVEGGYVYVTMYEGYLAKINAETFEYEVIPVGPNPDAVVASKGKLYVAASGGLQAVLNDEVDVVDIASFSVEKHLKVNANPSLLAVAPSGNSLYVYSFGNYAEKPAKVERVALSDGSVSDILEGLSGAPVSIAMGADGKLLVLMGGYAPDWSPLPGQVYAYDTKKEAMEGSLYTYPVANAYSLSADASKGYIFIGVSDYVNTGDVQVLDKAGKPLGHFSASGINPIKVMMVK